MGETLRADYGGMADLGRGLRTVSTEVLGQAPAVRSAADDVITGSGEFGSSLELGAATFVVSWTTALRTYAECVDLLSEQVAQTLLGLADTDNSVADLIPGTAS